MQFRSYFLPALLCLLASVALRGEVLAQGVEGSGTGLKGQSAGLPAPASGTNPPLLIIADQIEGRGENEVVATGKVEGRQLGRTVFADSVTYWQDAEEILATGNVRLINNGDVVTGPRLRLRMSDSTGRFDAPVYSLSPRTNLSEGAMTVLSKQPAAKKPDQILISPQAIQDQTTTPRFAMQGSADSLEFVGEDKYRLFNATLSSCRADREDWRLTVGEADLDYTRDVGVAHNALLQFKGVPLLYTPWIDFGLNDKRKTGLLPPTFGSTNVGGFDVTQPFYWNISPDRDATFTPRIISKRGIQFGNEFRYLNEKSAGEIHAEVLQGDALTKTTRYGVSVLHTQDFGYGFTGDLDLNKVSDDAYFRDLSGRIAQTSQTTLLRQGRLNYGGGWWSASAQVQRYQTLQDPMNPVPIEIPYDRMPQLALGASKLDVAGFDLNFSGEYADFSHPTKVLGKRTTITPSISYPIIRPGAFLTPKLAWSATQYRLDRQAAGTPQTITRKLPIFSLDSGLIFERDVTLRGQGYTQTLEPRLYYLNVPARDQTLIPNFDTAVADFNFAQIFSENSFSGGDRINDANQLTVGATSRLLSPSTGQEWVRGTIGERFYFKDQEVTLNSTQPGVIDQKRTARYSDYVAALSGVIGRGVSLDSAIQYSPRLSRTEKLTAGVRYQPEPGKVINLGYRFNRELLKQIDASGQWPLGGRWFGVGRYNFSLADHKIIETLGGLEYKEDCWVFRIVGQRFATSQSQGTTGLFLQLELNGLSGVWSNPINALKRSIPGFTRINQITTTPPSSSLDSSNRPLE